jgi:CHAT domain-containing protein
LELAGQPITLGEVFHRIRFRHNLLTVLTGCESGMMFPDLLDDHENFTTAFLAAGARCVISALWSVPDLPTALLMNKFYALWTPGVSAAAALRDSQVWLRTRMAGEQLNSALQELAKRSASPADAEELLRRSATGFVKAFGNFPFASPVHWAGFACHGAGHLR